LLNNLSRTIPPKYKEQQCVGIFIAIWISIGVIFGKKKLGTIWKKKSKKNPKKNPKKADQNFTHRSFPCHFNPIISYGILLVFINAPFRFRIPLYTFICQKLVLREILL